MKRSIGAVIFISAIALLLLTVDPPAPALAQDTQRVGLVVKFGDGTVFADCVDYTGPGMTGEDVLDASGLSTIKDTSYGLGAAICKIEDEGCDYPQPDSCFCECTGEPPCKYWAYYHLDRQALEWVYSGMGASWNTVRAGDIEGWAWGDGEYGGSEVAPPVMTFEELCPPSTPPIVDLYAEPEVLVAGQCSTLHWSVENGEVVALDGEGVRHSDARYVCPPQTHTYTLQVLNGAGDFSYEVTIKVTQPSPTQPPTPTATRAPMATAKPSVAPPPPATRTPQASTIPPSPTVAPSATPTSPPTLVAALPSATPTVGEDTLASGPVATSVPQPTSVETVPDQPQGESVGLDRILLLLGVGAGTLGFGTIVFLAMLLLLLAVYLRARAQF